MILSSIRQILIKQNTTKLLYWYSHWNIWHPCLKCFFIRRSKQAVNLEEEAVSSICFSDDFGSLWMQPMMLLACRYTGSALSSDYVLTNVPLAAEWPSVERADRTAPHWLQHSLMSYCSEIHKSSIPPLLYPCLSVTTTTLWPLPLRAERKTPSTIDSLIQMKKCIKEVESCVCCAFLCFIYYKLYVFRPNVFYR